MNRFISSTLCYCCIAVCYCIAAFLLPSWVVLVQCKLCMLINQSVITYFVDQRKAESTKIRDKYPERIPVTLYFCCMKNILMRLLNLRIFLNILKAWFKISSLFITLLIFYGIQFVASHKHVTNVISTLTDVVWMVSLHCDNTLCITLNICIYPVTISIFNPISRCRIFFVICGSWPRDHDIQQLITWYYEYHFDKLLFV